jgi:hypothetical protein
MATTSDPSTDYAATAYKSTTMIAGMIAASLVVYVIVAEILLRSPSGGEPPAFFGQLRIVLFVVAGVLIFMTTIIKGLLLRSASADPSARVARARAVSITAMALAEAPALCGLVLVALGGVRTDFYMLLVISCYMMVRHFPRRGPWDEYLSRPATDAVR